MTLALNQILVFAITIAWLAIAYDHLISIRQSSQIRESSEPVHHTEQVFQHIQKVVLSAPDHKTRIKGYVVIPVTDEFHELTQVFKKNLYGKRTRLKKRLDQKFLFSEKGLSRLNFNDNLLPDNIIAV